MSGLLGGFASQAREGAAILQVRMICSDFIMGILLTYSHEIKENIDSQKERATYIFMFFFGMHSKQGRIVHCAH